MIRWLSRQEKITGFEFHMKKNNTNSETIQHQPPAKKKPAISIAKQPNFPRRRLSLIEDKHNAPDFQYYLKVFLNTFTTNKVPNKYLSQAKIPFEYVDVYNMFRFHPQGIQDDDEENDLVRAFPRSLQNPRGRFNTVVAMIHDKAESTGLAGKKNNHLS